MIQHNNDRKNRTDEQFFIISLNLGTETYTQLLLPRGFDEVPLIEPTISVLTNCLCFSHDFKGTKFVYMEDDGIRSSRVLGSIP